VTTNQPEESQGGFIKWEDSFSVGDETIDSQHKKLFLIINELYDALMDDEVESRPVKEIAADLEDYTHYHFEAEETLMAKIGYTDCDHHVKEHKSMIQWIASLKTRLKDPAEGIRIEILMYLRIWLMNHILKADMELKPLIEAQT